MNSPDVRQAAAIDLDSASLRDVEDYIRPRLLGFIEAGHALLAIRQRRLYRDAGFDQFEVYCRDRWQMDAVHARRMCDAAQVAQIAASTNEPMGLLVENERQARELAPLLADPDELRAVWKETIERTQHTSAPLTASAIRMVRREREAARSPQPERPAPRHPSMMAPPPQPVIPPGAHRMFLILTQAIAEARAAGGAAAIREARAARPDITGPWYSALSDAAAFTAELARACQ